MYNFTSFSLYFSFFLFFLSFSLFLLSFMFIFLQINFFLKFSSDYWGGGKKGVLPPHPNYWGAAPRGAPPESTPMSTCKWTRYMRLGETYVGGVCHVVKFIETGT